MDYCRNVSVSSNFPSEYTPEQVLSPACSKLGGGFSTSLDELFPSENTEVDVSLEWLSIFVEDCLSSTGNYIPKPTPNPHSQPSKSPQKTYHTIPKSLQEFSIPSKARSKRRRTTTTPTTPLSHLPHNVTTSDPPLLHQAYWLADSELIILPKKEENNHNSSSGDEEIEKSGKGSLEGSFGQPRRCTHCLSQRTPQWRTGPLGPKTLCNACGVRFKSGRLLPEYRPAKSPTFVSYKHSNSHKKVMEMRMSIPSSNPL